MNTLNKSWRKGFEIAKAVIQYSDGKTPGRRLGAALFNGNKLLSVGFNKLGQSHPIGFNGKHDRSIHAEVAALIKRKHYDDTGNLIMYVYRENYNNVPVCSKPCSMCEALMREAGIKRVRYINSEGIFVEMKL